MINYLFIDVETTGINHKIHGIHQLSGCIEINSEVVEEFNYRIKPFIGCIIDEESLKISHTTIEELKTFQSEFEVFMEFSILLKRYVNQFKKDDKFFVVGYNVQFDIDFIEALFIRNNNYFLYSLIWADPLDVRVLAIDKLRFIRHELEDFKLKTVVKVILGESYLDESKLHNAEYDIYLTYEVFQKLVTPHIDCYQNTNINNFNLINDTELLKDMNPKLNWVEDDFINKSIPSKLVPIIKLPKPIPIILKTELLESDPIEDDIDDFLERHNAIRNEFDPPEELSQEEIKAAQNDLLLNYNPYPYNNKFSDENVASIIENNEIETTQNNIFDVSKLIPDIFDPSKLLGGDLMPIDCMPVDDNDKFSDENKTIKTFWEDTKPILNSNKKPIITSTPKQNNLMNDFLKPTNAKPINTNTGKEIQSIIKINTKDYIMFFGKHNGWKIEQILKINPGYIIWLHDNHIKGIIVCSEILSEAIKLNNKMKESFNEEQKFSQRNYKSNFGGTEFDLEPTNDDLPF